MKRNSRESEVAALFGKETTQCIVPRNDSSDNAEGTSSNLQRSASIEFGGSQKDEGDKQEEEKSDKSAVGAVRGNQHNSGEDGPSEEVDTKRVFQVLGGCLGVGVENTSSRNKD